MTYTPGDIRPSEEDEVIEALNEDDFETAVEICFSIFPSATRDEMVDLADAIDTNRKFRNRCNKKV